MLWCQGAQKTGLSKRKLKSTLKCTMHALPRRIDRQTDEHYGNSTMIRSTNTTHAKNERALKKN